MSNRLHSYKKNVFSQFGEDGIIEEIFNVLPAQDSYHCVEFGAWDGIFLSNTHHLIKNKGWNGVLIEANEKKFEELKINCSVLEKAILIHRKVDFEGENRLDEILAQTNVPLDFDLLSIDIDGNDYHIWDSLSVYSPKLVVIEFNFSIPSDIEYIQAKDFGVNHGNSLLALVNLGKEKGYELVATTDCNGFFVKKEYFALFEIANNTIQEIWDTENEAPRIMQMYDGTLVLSSSFQMPWNGKVVDKLDLQVIPKYARHFGDATSINWFKKVCLFLYRRVFS